MLLLVLFATLQVSASVSLVRLEVVPNAAEGTLTVQWETATELDTLLFRLYRSLDDTDWGAPILEEPARGSGITGATYQYTDDDVTPSVRYWYLLEEVTTNGSTALVGITSGGINVPTLTPTSTASPTRTTTPIYTATPQPGGSQPAATATQRFTNTPIPVTPIAAPPTSAGFAQPTATPLPPITVATPTGNPLAPTLFAPAVSPTPEPTATETPLLAPPTATATVVVIAQQPSPEMTRTPSVFEASGTGETPLSPAAPTATPDDGRDTQRLLLIGGGAVALAVLLSVAILFVVRARQ